MNIFQPNVDSVAFGRVYCKQGKPIAKQKGKAIMVWKKKTMEPEFVTKSVVEAILQMVDQQVCEASTSITNRGG